MNAEKRKRMSFLPVFAAAVLSFILLGFIVIAGADFLVILSVLIFSLIMILIMFFCNYANKRYVSDMVSKLSDLTDSLAELDDRKVFPDNEDTLPSKLQNKVIKLTEQMKEKNRKTEEERENIKSLVTDISHQIKTPVSNIIMYSELLENAQKGRNEYAAVIKYSAKRLEFLTENMIRITRLESGIINLKIVSQSLNETALKAIKDVYIKARDKGVEIKYSEDGMIESLHDKNWTSEAIFNLLDNAVKYSQKGSCVFVELKRYGMFAAVCVSDENKPIDEDERNMIFKRFYRGKNSGMCGGIGIGLYLSREIISRQGGYIKLKSCERGNTFSIVLPCSGGL